MKLLKTINKTPANNCVILTYNVDLLFYEQLLFEPLYASGCRNSLIFCDPYQYQIALSDVERLKFAGQRYSLIPSNTSKAGVFHPKVFLLTTESTGHLFVTSGNLTKAGLSRNLEVVTLFEFNTKKPDSISWSAFDWAFRTLKEIANASGLSEVSNARLDQLWATTPWLRQGKPPASIDNIWLLNNFRNSIFDQVIEYYRKADNSPISDVIIVSPFYDSKLLAIEKFVEETNVKSLSLYTQKISQSINPETLDKIAQRYGVEFIVNELVLDNRRLHAKALLMRTDKGAWLVTGSANFSRPAWLHTSSTGNTEIIVLRYENNRKYYDDWFQNIIHNAEPMDFSNYHEVVMEPYPADTRNPITLLSAKLEGELLVIRFSENISQGGVLSIRFNGEKRYRTFYEEWQQKADKTVSLVIEKKALICLESPTLVDVSLNVADDILESNSVLLHNLVSIERFSKPLVRKQRPNLPPGMVPESYKHCAQILDMLMDLAANNVEDIYRHRGRIGAKAGKKKPDETIDLGGGEYDPQEHFPDELIRRISMGVGADLYADYHDRLTYEEILRVAHSVVYSPDRDNYSSESHDGMNSEGEMTSEEGTVIITSPNAPDANSNDNNKTLKKIISRIEKGFKKIVNNFKQGAEDSEYLANISPSYLIELYVIITTYLHVVWKDKMLSTPLFLDLSLDLFSSFWGNYGHEGIWGYLQSRTYENELSGFDQKYLLSVRTCLQVYLLSMLLEQNSDRRINDLSAWVRQIMMWGNFPGDMNLLDKTVYQYAWNSIIPKEFQFQSTKDAESHIYNIANYYDEVSLLKEINALDGARAHIDSESTAGIHNVPALKVSAPFTIEDLDLCLKQFKTFLYWPRPKQLAWGRFTNANPIFKDSDLDSVTIFYRGDYKSLLFAVRRASGKYYPDYFIEDISLEMISEIGSVNDLDSIKPNN